MSPEFEGRATFTDDFDARVAALQADIRAEWWERIPVKLQNWLLAEAKIPLDADIRTLDRLARLQIVRVAERRIADLTPATHLR